VTAVAYFKARLRYLNIGKQKITNFLDEYWGYLGLKGNRYCWSKSIKMDDTSARYRNELLPPGIKNVRLNVHLYNIQNWFLHHGNTNLIH
jgi:hypothetical protein